MTSPYYYQGQKKKITARTDSSHILEICQIKKKIFVSDCRLFFGPYFKYLQSASKNNSLTDYLMLTNINFNISIVTLSSTHTKTYKAQIFLILMLLYFHLAVQVCPIPHLESVAEI